jgi:hypothetical protein
VNAPHSTTRIANAHSETGHFRRERAGGVEQLRGMVAWTSSPLMVGSRRAARRRNLELVDVGQIAADQHDAALDLARQQGRDLRIGEHIDRQR